MALRDHLNAFFDAERAAREAESKLFAGSEKEVAALLIAATSEALELGDRAESFLRLRRLPDLLAQVPTPATIDSILAILDAEDEALRVEAGEALLDVAFERFKEVATAIERLLDRKHDGLAMRELPFVLTEVHDPDPMPLVARFLLHPDAEIAAAAIDALVQYGDPAAIAPIEKLTGDRRPVSMDDLDDAPATLGDLAASAIEELGGSED